MDILPWIIGITAIAGVGGTGIGGIISALIRRDSKKLVSLLLSFAAGIMLAVVCFDMLLDAMFAEGSEQPHDLGLVILGVMIGFGVIATLNYIIDRNTNHEIKHINEQHPRTADALDELIHSDHYMAHRKNNSHLFTAGIIMASAIALHNLPEGMVIGAAFANSGGIAFGGSGMVIAIVIGLHNIPEGMAVAVPLIAGGMSRSKAILTTALSGAPTILGALIGYFMGTLSPEGLAISLSFASGAMLYVVFGELLPESILMWRSKMPALAILIGMLAGMLIIYA